MQFLLLGLAALVVVLFVVQAVTRANPGVMVRRLRVALGIILLSVAAGLMLRGAAGPASLAAMFGVWLIWGRGSGVLGLPGGTKSTGQTSHIVTDYLEVELDHDTGSVHGQVLKGSFTGRTIEDLSPEEMAELWYECRFADTQSAQVLEAYLDRAHPEWRDDAGAEARGESGDASGVMSRDEAYAILGLKSGASHADIRAAHRELMLKIHPDRGGSTYLASKINQAKEMLLNG